jgi:2-iminobutanoate/2-iminopropanoate deaminase
MNGIVRKEFRIDDFPPPLSHYTDVVTHGNLAFLSGFLAVDSDGKVVGEGDVVTQARQVHEYMSKALDAVGSSFADVLKVTVYLRDISDRGAINSIRQEYFGDHRPASTLVEISSLAVPGALVEIEAVAAIAGGKHHCKR